MKLIYFLAIALSSYSFHSQGATEIPKVWGKFRREVTLGKNLLVAKNLTNIPKGLEEKFPPAEYNHFAIDLNQDGIEDYILESKTDWKTCFVRSDLTLQSCEKLNYSKSDGFAYEYFVSQGKSKMLLLFDFSGDEDSDEFSLKQFDPKTWQLTKIMKVFPVIDSHSSARKGLHWGYPWDIKDISTKLGGDLKIQATFAHKLYLPSEGTHGEKGPAVLFSGVATQDDPVDQYKHLRSKFKYESIENLKKRLSTPTN